MNGPMVRALLAGNKSQTRRVLKTQPYPNGMGFDRIFGDILCHNDHLPPSAMLLDVRRGGISYTTSDLEGWQSECPYGQPGDRLWVREQFSGPHALDGIPPAGWGCNLTEVPIWYWADGNPEHGDWTRPKPSIHMPRRFSRIVLEVTAVRVQRLHDISEEDARAEGITDGGCTECGNPEPCGCSNPSPSASDSFIWLWNSINGANAWTLNPYVWAVSFKRVEASA